MNTWNTIGEDDNDGHLHILRGYGCVREVHVARWPVEYTPGSYPALMAAIVPLEPSRDRPAVLVRVDLRNTHGQFEIKSVNFSNDSFGRVRLSGADLRRVNLDRVLEDCIESVVREQFRLPAGSRLDSSFVRVGRPGRRGRPDVFYAAVARRFVELAGAPRVVVRMAQEMDVSAGAIARWISYARDKSLLTRPGKGRQGGELTPAAERLLADYSYYDQHERP